MVGVPFFFVWAGWLLGPSVGLNPCAGLFAGGGCAASRGVFGVCCATDEDSYSDDRANGGDGGDDE